MEAEAKALRGAIEAMARAAERPTEAVALGKAYAGVARAMVALTEATGQTSMRYEAVQKALDLTTKKSALEAFLER